MQVRVSAEGHLVIPAPIRQQLGLGPGACWLEIAVDRGILHASVLPSQPSHRVDAPNTPAFSRLATLKPHPEAMGGPDEDLDQAKVWDEAEWHKEWDV